MQPNQVEEILAAALELQHIQVKANGNHYEVIAVGECFDGVSRVKKQQLIYGPLMEKIADGTIHAVSIRAFTPKEWERESKLMALQ
jgi:acid stress-induced BolA-like protein IbaG/YrbA